MLIIILVAISLSMDAFSLSLAYGMQCLKLEKIKKLTIIVGIFHFFMPLGGFFLGKFFYSFIPVDQNIIIVIVLSFIGIQMIYESFKNKTIHKELHLLEMLGLSFVVSLDSFSTGFGLTNLSGNIFISTITFAITSSVFTYLGLKLGNKLSDKFGKYSTIIGGISLLIIGFSHIF